MLDGLPSKEEILAEQRKDPFCNTRKPGTHSSKSVYFWTTPVSYISAGPIINIS